jgi:hypothetical protein
MLTHAKSLCLKVTLLSVCADLQIPGDPARNHPELDNAMEHLITTGRHSLFTLNRRCAELRIMDVKLRYDLFNMLVQGSLPFEHFAWGQTLLYYNHVSTIIKDILG